jgi:hypothetical protein
MKQVKKASQIGIGQRVKIAGSWYVKTATGNFRKARAEVKGALKRPGQIYTEAGKVAYGTAKPYAKRLGSAYIGAGKRAGSAYVRTGKKVWGSYFKLGSKIWSPVGKAVSGKASSKRALSSLRRRRRLL